MQKYGAGLTAVPLRRGPFAMANCRYTGELFTVVNAMLPSHRCNMVDSRRVVECERCAGGLRSSMWLDNIKELLQTEIALIAFLSEPHV